MPETARREGAPRLMLNIPPRRRALGTDGVSPHACKYPLVCPCGVVESGSWPSGRTGGDDLSNSVSCHPPTYHLTAARSLTTRLSPSLSLP